MIDPHLKERAIQTTVTMLEPLLKEYEPYAPFPITQETKLDEIEQDYYYRNDLTAFLEEALDFEISHDDEDEFWEEGTVGALAWLIFRRMTRLSVEPLDADDLEAGLEVVEAARLERLRRKREPAAKQERPQDREAPRKEAAVQAEIARHESAFRQAFEAIVPPISPSLADLLGGPAPYIPSGRLIEALDARFQTDLAQRMQEEPKERRLFREDLYEILKDAFFRRLERSWPEIDARTGDKGVAPPAPAWLQAAHPLRDLRWAELLCLAAAWISGIALIDRSVAWPSWFDRTVIAWLIEPLPWRAPSPAELFSGLHVENLLLGLALLPATLATLRPRLLLAEPPSLATAPAGLPAPPLPEPSYAPEDRLQPAPQPLARSIRRGVEAASRSLSNFLAASFALVIGAATVSAALPALNQLWPALIVCGLIAIAWRTALRDRRARRASAQGLAEEIEEQKTRREEEAMRRVNLSYLAFLAAAFGAPALFTMAFAR